MAAGDGEVAHQQFGDAGRGEEPVGEGVPRLGAGRHLGAEPYELRRAGCRGGDRIDRRPQRFGLGRRRVDVDGEAAPVDLDGGGRVAVEGGNGVAEVGEPQQVVGRLDGEGRERRVGREPFGQRRAVGAVGRVVPFPRRPDGAEPCDLAPGPELGGEVIPPGPAVGPVGTEVGPHPLQGDDAVGAGGGQPGPDEVVEATRVEDRPADLDGPAYPRGGGEDGGGGDLGRHVAGPARLGLRPPQPPQLRPGRSLDPWAGPLDQRVEVLGQRRFQRAVGGGHGDAGEGGGGEGVLENPHQGVGEHRPGRDPLGRLRQARRLAVVVGDEADDPVVVDLLAAHPGRLEGVVAVLPAGEPFPPAPGRRRRALARPPPAPRDSAAASAGGPPAATRPPPPGTRPAPTPPRRGVFTPRQA